MEAGRDGESLIQKIAIIVGALHEIATDIVNVATLEYRLAKRSLSLLVLVVPFMGLSLLGFWLFFLFAASQFLTEAGLSQSLSFLSVAGLNIVLLVMLRFIIKYLVANLYFKVTRRQLQNLSGANIDLVSAKAEKKPRVFREKINKK